MKHKNFSIKQNYISRINRVIDFIDANFDSDLYLERLAEIAAFSKFHFHRVFYAMTGETLNDYIKRIRLQNAAVKLICNTGMSMTEIALDCGFNSSANFSRVFKDYYKISPSEYKLNFKDKNRNNCKVKGKNRKEIPSEFCYNDNVFSKIKVENNKILRRIFDMKIEVKQMPEFKVIYARHIGPYNKISENGVWEKICKWAGSRNLINQNSKYIGVGYDNPEITPAEKCRYDACISLEKEVEVSGEIGKNVIPAGRFVVCRYVGKVEGIAGAYHNIFANWLPDSGYQPGDNHSYDIYYSADCGGKNSEFVMDICIPVKPL